jgi:outer membrane immunogenic protein
LAGLSKPRKKLQWFATARARLGYTDGDWLWYVTGGGAWGEVHNDFRVFENFLDITGSTNFNQSGWVVGAGVETHLWGAWTGKLEYLYMDLGSITDSAVQGGVPWTMTSDIRDHIVRVGLNYNFAATTVPPHAYAANPGRAVFKAPPSHPPVWSWTGFYIGANAGGSVGRDRTTQSELPSIGSNQIVGSFTMSPTGFIGGGQIGYNYQFTPQWLVGLEGDFQGASQSDSVCVLECSPTPVIDTTITATQKLKWFATARARIGYTDGDWLWYVTGGGVWGGISESVSLTNVPAPGAVSADHNKSGLTVGGGVETYLWGAWTGKLEYLYMDLGSITDSFTVSPGIGVQTWTTTSDIRDHIIRAGLNYKFN